MRDEGHHGAGYGPEKLLLARRQSGVRRTRESGNVESNPMQRLVSLNCISFRLGGAALLVLLLCLLLPSQLFAQSYELRVTLHDSSGRALVGVTIIVRDEAGQELTRATTDANGAASFAELPAVVRVAVNGQMRGGPQLYQLGGDAQGVRLDLGQGSGSAVLDLRVERDGLVLPDPATMLSLEEGGPVVEDTIPIPTALLATPAPLPTTSSSTSVVSVSQPPPAGEERRDGWMPLATVLVVALAAGLMVLVQHRRNAP